VNVRAVTDEDLGAVAAVAAADEEALNGRPSHIGADEVRDWLQFVDRERDAWLFEEDGRIAGIGWFGRWGEIGHGTGFVAQGFKGQGLGAEIVSRIEAAAAREGVPRIHSFALAADEAAQELFRGRGFREVRRFYEMAIELDAPPEPPAVAVEEFGPDDAREFHAALDESFRDHWEHQTQSFDEWWGRRHDEWYDAQGPIFFLVRDGGEVAAVIRNEARENGGYVGALGVRRAYRGRGYAKALLLHSFRAFWDRGLRRVTLGVDSESPTRATHLYERVGMHVETVVITFEKALA
jgi:ribosomal protein S18 acetylase RimI-like enzyme